MFLFEDEDIHISDHSTKMSCEWDDNGIKFFVSQNLKWDLGEGKNISSLPYNLNPEIRVLTLKVQYGFQCASLQCLGKRHLLDVNF